MAESPADASPANRQGVFKQRWASLLFSNASEQPQTSDQAATRTDGLCGRFDPQHAEGISPPLRR